MQWRRMIGVFIRVDPASLSVMLPTGRSFLLPGGFTNDQALHMTPSPHYSAVSIREQMGNLTGEEIAM